jgi:hypothetical protein
MHLPYFFKIHLNIILIILPSTLRQINPVYDPIILEDPFLILSSHLHFGLPSGLEVLDVKFLCQDQRQDPMSTRNNLSQISGEEFFHNSDQYLKKLYVVCYENYVLRINLIIPVDRTTIAQDSKLSPRPDKDFGSICAN